MHDFLFVLPLLLCISALIYLLAFTLRAAALVQPDAGRFLQRSESAIVLPHARDTMTDEPEI